MVTDGMSANNVSTIGSGALQATHLYVPSPCIVNLYQVTVTLENLHALETWTDLRYHHVMDWNISPTLCKGCVTINTGTSVAFWEYASNGRMPPILASVPPTHFCFKRDLDYECPEGASCLVIDNCPLDHGALFQFLFKGADDVAPLDLGPGGSFVFKMFYGAAPNT